MGQYGKYNSVEEIPPEERKYYHIMDKFRKVEEIEFVDKLVNERWTVKLPRFIAEYHEWWPYWELQCHLSMVERLKPGMLLYDIGAYDGWQSAMFSQFVGGPENMVLIEPVPENWANTKATWEANNLPMPKATYMGFAGDRDTANYKVNTGAWPEGPDYSQIIKSIKFRLLHEHADHTECMKLDTLATYTSIPDALHIDVEGAALLVLRGAEGILREKRLLVWVAIHPEFMRDRFHIEPQELHDFMASLGYKGQHLATDHEEHWFFEKQ